MKIRLEDWAKRNYSPPPAINTLRAWANAGLIVPEPVKVGRAWMVEEDAEYSPVAPVCVTSDRVAAILRKSA